jgi:alanine-glyoxylate transaminase / serine-glyoxylate transaminase / serine-pyruvate transaminase
MEIYNETQALLRQFLNSQNDLFIVPGPASALLDMALGSLVCSGEKVVVGTNGFFGDRLVEIANGYGAQVVPFTAPLDKPLDPDTLRKLLKENPEAQVVALVHHETGTTVHEPAARAGCSCAKRRQSAGRGYGLLAGRRRAAC